MTKNIGINAILNIIKTSLSILFPLITYPYISRVLGVENLGKVNYAAIFVNYFSILATLGISAYAVREGSKIRDDKKKLRTLGSQLFSINIISMILSYTLLVIVLIAFVDNIEYRNIILLQSLVILFTTLSVDWINVLFEDFFYITVRTIIIQVMSLVLLFIFVRTSSDIYQYIIISILSSGISCLINFFYCKRYLKLSIVFSLNIKKHLPKIVILFLCSAAISIYVNLDVLFIEKFNGIYYVGIYVIASKVYGVLKVVLSSAYFVTIPKLSGFYARKDIDSFKELYTKIISYLLLVLFPISIGIIVFSEKIILFMGGKDYLAAVPVLQVLSISLIGAILGGLLTSVLNVSLGKESISLKGAVLGVFLSIILNTILTPKYMHLGAAISVCITEFFIFLYNLLVVKEYLIYIKINDIKKTLFNLLAGCCIIISFSCIIKGLNLNIWLESSALIFGNIFLYFLTLFLLKESILFNILSILNLRKSN